MVIRRSRTLCLFACLALAASIVVAADQDIAAVLKKSRELNNTDRPAAAQLLKDAIADYTALTKAKPAEAANWYGLACLTFELGQNDAAAQAAIEKALSLSPNEPRFHVQQGLMFFQLGKKVEAEREYRRAVELAPQSAEYRLELSQLLHSLMRPDEALAEYDTILRIDPRNVTALIRSALKWIDKGEPDKAIELARRAKEFVAAEDVSLKDHLGQVLQDLSQHEDAYAVYAELLAREPDTLRFAARLVQLCQAMGRTEERNRRLKSVYELHKQDKSGRPFFCREDFRVGETRVLAMECFQPNGAFKTLLSFMIVDKIDPNRVISRISLDTPEVTTQVARETGGLKDKDDRAYAIEHYQGNSNTTYLLTLGKAPSYETARAKAVEIIEGKATAIGGATARTKK